MPKGFLEVVGLLNLTVTKFRIQLF
jgi:hypothetical protein